MPSQERIQKQRSSTKHEEAAEIEVKKVDTEDLKSEMDDILDSIDEVLEENAEEFVKGYVQKGGE